MNLYEITEKLKARGCPEHPRLRYRERTNVGERNERGPYWHFKGHGVIAAQFLVHPDDARAIWTQWALAWAKDDMHTGDKREIEAACWLSPTSKWLEAIEAATRHMEATNESL